MWAAAAWAVLPSPRGASHGWVYPHEVSDVDVLGSHRSSRATAWFIPGVNLYWYGTCDFWG